MKRLIPQFAASVTKYDRNYNCYAHPLNKRKTCEEQSTSEYQMCFVHVILFDSMKFLVKTRATINKRQPKVHIAIDLNIVVYFQLHSRTASTTRFRYQLSSHWPLGRTAICRKLLKMA